jgi:hypothetical protein
LPRRGASAIRSRRTFSWVQPNSSRTSRSLLAPGVRSVASPACVIDEESSCLEPDERGKKLTRRRLTAVNYPDPYVPAFDGGSPVDEVGSRELI